MFQLGACWCHPQQLNELVDSCVVWIVIIIVKAIQLWPIVCWGHFEVWKDFQSISRSQYLFLVETSSFTRISQAMGQLRPTCPHTRKASKPNHTYLCATHKRCLLSFGVVIGFRSSLAQIADSRFPKAQCFSWSLVYRLHRATYYTSCRYTVHFHPHIVH